MPYAIEYQPDTIEHLEALSARERAMVFDGVREQLTHQPKLETRNRKPMRSNLLAQWELRIGPLPVYYDIEEEPEPKVVISAVGIKQGNLVRIANKIVKL
jgi:mRNA-degrading endonuclease RelE of RelBE toxin-antitoxin system